MKLYMYRKDTKEYFGSMNANLDPLETRKRGTEVYVIPPFCTPFPPLKEKEGKVNVFNESKKIWELIEDNRGSIIYGKNGEKLIMTELGSLPEGFTKKKKTGLQEERLEKLSLLSALYTEAQNEKVQIINIDAGINEQGKLEKLKETAQTSGFAIYCSDDGATTIVSKDIIDYALKYLHIRSLLLVIKRNDIEKKITKAKSRALLAKVKIDFNILKKTAELALKSDEEINNYIKEHLE